MGKIRILGVNIEYDAGNIRILDSYKVHSAAYKYVYDQNWI